MYDKRPDDKRPDDKRPVLVLLHGLGQSPLVWQEAVGSLGVEYSIRCPWIPGLKPVGNDTFDVERAAHGLASQLELEGVQQASLVGVSVGAMVALRVAAAYPDLVTRLLLCAGQIQPPGGRLQLMAMRATPRARFLELGVDKDRVISVLSGLSQIDLSDDLAKIHCPTLVTVGGRDRANVPAARDLAAGIPGAELRMLDGLGAQPNAEDPAGFSALIRDFMTIPPE